MTFPAAVFLGLVLVFLLSVIWGIAKIVSFVYREMGAIGIVILVVAAVATPVIAWNRYAHRHFLSHVPAALGVTTVSFEASALMGFGPGGSEEGLLLYELPEAAAYRIEQGGVDYLNGLREDPSIRHSQSDYSAWQPTPGNGRGLPVEGELCVYDECSVVPDNVRKQVNTALASPGNYFAHYRSSKTIIVSPRARLIVVRYGK